MTPVQSNEQIDPVCGMPVDPNQKPLPEMRIHRSNTFLFCSPVCATKFELEPDKYIEDGPESPSKNRDEYPKGFICPMCPQVWNAQPDICPSCGMALEAANPLIDEADDTELPCMRRRFTIAAIFAFPVFAVAMPEHLPGLQGWVEGKWTVWLQFLLSTPVIVWAGYPLFERGLRSLVPWRPNMFTLIALGVGMGYGFSLLALILPDLFPAQFRGEDGTPSLYFESSAVIVTLVLLGQVMELKARAQTGKALRLLLDLTPKTARRIIGTTEEELSNQELAIGDVLRVFPGERIPTDGIVLNGTSSIDESMVTGEAIPTAKGIGSHVVGGTINGLGHLTIRAESVGSETVLSRIAATVAHAQHSRAPIQRIADRLAAYFVPTVIAAAVLTFTIWAFLGPEPAFSNGLVAAISVLIIACPCALGLATPMSIMVAMGRGALAGILIRNAETLERFGHVDTLVIDKTGTITKGKPAVSSVITTHSIAETELVKIAASLEAQSEHPLGTAILDHAYQQGIPPSSVKDFYSITGQGVGGYVGSVAAFVGNKNFINNSEIDTSALDGAAEDLRRKGASVVYCIRANELLGLIAINDSIKNDAEKTLSAIRDIGIRIVMVTGDARTTAEAISIGLPVDDIYADVSPIDKLKIIEQLRAEGRNIAMVGDGINDAPALAGADIGIAMGTGSDIAMESSDITLVGGALAGLLRARRLSIATMWNIRQNLIFAFAYNALRIPVAAGILYPLFSNTPGPMFAAIAMCLSSVTIIGNALRLRTKQI